MAKKDDNEWSIDRIMDEFSAGLANVARKPNNLMYKPDPQQLPFHATEKKGKQYIGGNRSGKTTAGINEDIWWLRGQHPFRRVPEPPVIGRVTTVDFKNGATKIIIPTLRQWIPPSLLINGSWEDSYNGQTNVLTCSNGSELEIMSYDQDLDKFAGVPRHFTHFDEEPPKDIYRECLMRLIDYDGSWWMTMTPIDGMNWTFEEIYEPSLGGKNPRIEIVEATPYGNSHLKKEAIDAMMDNLEDEDERDIRARGKYVAIGGLIFYQFDPDTHIIPAKVPPANWTHYVSLDVGLNNPSAALWHAVSPDGIVVTYDEIYRANLTIEQLAGLINDKEAHYRKTHGIIPFLHIADPAIKQRQQQTGLSTQIALGDYGLNFVVPKSRDVSAGLDKMNNYFRTNRWFITENCIKFRWEIRIYRHDQYATSKMREKNNKKDSPLKKNDHACDSARYFFQFQPELNVKELEKKPLPNREVVANLLGGVRHVVQGNVDTNLFNVPTDQTYFVTEVGEF